MCAFPVCQTSSTNNEPNTKATTAFTTTATHKQQLVICTLEHTSCSWSLLWLPFTGSRTWLLAFQKARNNFRTSFRLAAKAKCMTSESALVGNVRLPDTLYLRRDKHSKFLLYRTLSTVYAFSCLGLTLCLMHAWTTSDFIARFIW